VTIHRHLLVLALGVGLVGAACDSEPEPSVDALDMGADVEGGRELGTSDHPADSGDGRDAGLDLDGADGQPDGDGGADGVEAGPPLMAEQSFTVAATITSRPRGPSGGLASMPQPSMMEMMLRLDPVGRRLIIGAAGVARVVGLRPATGSAFETTAPFMIPARGTGACSATVTVESLTIDARSSWLSGQGTGVASLIYGDVVYPHDATVTLAGPRDTTGPSLGENVDGVDPLGALALTVSEPVAGVAARLVLGGERVDLVPSRDADQIVGFAKPMALALLYGTTYQVEADAWSDLAQNAGRTLPKLTTRALPELSPEDGFESAGAMLGGAVVVQSPDYPVLAGNKSVFVTPRHFSGVSSPRFTVRLARAANDVVVRVTVRPVGVYAPTVGAYGVNLRIAVPGGSIVNATLPMNEDVPTMLPGTSSRPPLNVGAARTVEIALPPMAGPEIVFDLSSQTPEGCGLFPPTAGYLIDDLRID
jgi:hypothetical protein